MYKKFNQVEDKHWWFQARKEIVIKLIDRYYKLKHNAKVLDLGCGTGMMLNYLSKYGKVFGLDNNLEAIKYSKKKSPQAKIIFGSLPDHLPKEKFDLITALDLIEHIDKDTDGLEAISNILKPKGILIITVPAYQFLWSGQDKLSRHKRRYTLSELKIKLKQAGFEIKKISYYNTMLFLPAALVKFLNKFIWQGSPKSHFEKMPNCIINQMLKMIFSSEKHLLPFLNFPFGVSIIAIASKK